MNKEETENMRRFKATTPGKRFIKLASMSARIAHKFAANRIKGFFREAADKELDRKLLMTEIGEQVAQTLGEMKGAVMKVGQIASQVKDLFPAEVASALTKLQSQSPSMPFSLIREQIVKGFDAVPERLFAELDPVPFAAASIGQVHRATLHDKTPVVVKVQYPGVRESCDSDLKHLRNLFQLVGLLKVDEQALDDVFNEVRNILYEELDYENEARNIEEFYRIYSQDDSIRIPRVYRDLSNEHILTLSYEPGIRLSEVKVPDFSQEIINKIGHRLFQLVCEQMLVMGAMHADPHAGNFACTHEGVLIVYDFGAIKRLKLDVIADLKALTQATLNYDYPNIEALLCKRGMRRPGTPTQGEAFYKEWLDILSEPFKDNSAFDFGTSDLHERALRKLKGNMLKGIELFQPTPESIHIHRVFSGHYWNLVNLKAKLSLKQTLLQFIKQP